MKRIIQPLLLLIAHATDKELARMVEYLKVENRILRGKLSDRITVTPRERQRLVKYGRKLGAAIKNLITIVSPRTFARWLSGERTPARKPSRPGRPRTPEEIRELILRIARESGFGYTRILGELKKVGIRSVSRSTVVNILKENGLDPGPDRGEGSWDEFIKRHAQTLWACDFFSKKIWTLGGLVDMFVLFFVHIGTRRVFVSGMTINPDRAWVVQQARNTSMYFSDQPTAATHLLIDHDTKFVREFDQVLESDGIEVKRMGPVAPNLNAFAERFVQSIKQECLDHFVVFGEDHMRHIVKEYVEHFNTERPHQAMANRPLLSDGEADVIPIPVGEVICEERLGGLLKHYCRAA